MKTQKANTSSNKLIKVNVLSFDEMEKSIMPSSSFVNSELKDKSFLPKIIQPNITKLGSVDDHKKKLLHRYKDYLNFEEGSLAKFGKDNFSKEDFRIYKSLNLPTVRQRLFESLKAEQNHSQRQSHVCKDRIEPTALRKSAQYPMPPWTLKGDEPTVKNISFRGQQEKRRNLNGYLDCRGSTDLTFLKGNSLFTDPVTSGRACFVDYSKLLEIFEEEFD